MHSFNYTPALTIPNPLKAIITDATDDTIVQLVKGCPNSTI
jgi:hypothetical protein